MSKPSILLIPGSFGLPELYDPLMNAVAAQGYEVRDLHYPGVGLKTGPREGPPPTMYDDSNFIVKETEKLADEGKDIILIAHSYGGEPMTESTKGLSKAERQAQGKPGGIVRLAYITAIVPPVGASSATMMGEVPEENQIDLKIDEEGETWMARFAQHSAVSFTGELTHAGYKDIPVSYLLCERDLCIPPAAQRKGIDLIEKVSGRKADVTSINAGHVPNVGSEREVIEWIMEVLRKS